ncbi:MAG: DUF547 domain-containing protein [Bacteroidota bacterium]
MKNKVILTLSAVLLISISSFAQSDLGKFFSGTDAFLKKYVKNGAVDYKGIKANPTALNNLYKQVGGANLSGKSDAEKKAFYINAYNVLVVYQVVKNYPIQGPLKVEGFFNNTSHKVAGKTLTLDGVEKGTLFKAYPDARIHFAVVCAAVGCPQLANFAFTPAKVEQQLTTRTKASVDRDYFIRVNDSKKEVQISKIFEWYGKDFGGDSKAILAYINKYRTKKIPSSYKVSYYEYDWNLNKQ